MGSTGIDKNNKQLWKSVLRNETICGWTGKWMSEMGMHGRSGGRDIYFVGQSPAEGRRGRKREAKTKSNCVQKRFPLPRSEGNPRGRASGMQNWSAETFENCGPSRWIRRGKYLFERGCRGAWLNNTRCRFQRAESTRSKFKPTFAIEVGQCRRRPSRNSELGKRHCIRIPFKAKRPLYIFLIFRR